MLKNENTMPEILGYDRPSPKLISFLSKYFGLKKYIPQNNNYVVFSQYFEYFVNLIRKKKIKILLLKI